MSRIADIVALVFNPLFIIGTTRLYVILDSIRKYKGHLWESVHYPEIHVPLICCAFSLACSVLSHDTNRKYVLVNPEFRTYSLLGILTFTSAACIMLMFYFVVDFNQIFWWFRSYALLCLVNAIWNFFAVTPQTRFPYVWANIFLFLIIISISFFETKMFIYLLLIIIVMTKLWHRSRPREFKTIGL